MTRRSRRALALAAAILLAAALIGSGLYAVAARPGPDVPTTEVTRGEFVDYVEVRGDLRAGRSVVLSAPMQAGELQIVRLAKNGTAVKSGDVVVEFDSTTLRRTVQEKQSELRQAEAEIEQSRGQAAITDERNRTALLKARYDVERARLEVGQRDVIARLDYEKAKLALADAEQRQREAEAKAASDGAAAAADLASRQRKREKVMADLARAEQSLGALQLKATAGGLVSIMPNFRAGGPFGGQQEFREGDRAWAGANLVELPDTSSLHVEARLDESDRGRVRPGQRASLKVDAVPDREFGARVKDIAVLARVDFSSGWPPPRNFDLKLAIDERDSRLRPGMSATARIAVGSLPNVLLAPSEAVQIVGGKPTVYRLVRSRFEPSTVTVVRRGRDQVALASGVSVGDRIALKKPPHAGDAAGRSAP
ncbi:MAG TPA: efflux RND transporter periplasmic adaptor subunit [Vicinamibacterales bacterium]|nr:efflux RND transporter periplasmic adaptor subunit [Vicinamibacterales bacterium]